jgi:Tol biopolymer transport system component
MSSTTRLRSDRKLQIVAAAATFASIVLLCWLAPSAGAAFPGINGKITFVGNPPTGQPATEIMTMNPDGSGLTQLTSDSPNLDPSFSPDGTRIVFAHAVGGGSNFEIFVMNADGSGKAQLTFDSGTDWSPSFSPDGQKIVFQSDRTGDNQIFSMNADGSGQTNLSNNSQDDLGPSFSPLGGKIVFSRLGSFGSADDPISQIHIMNPDGSGQVNLSNDLASTDGDPSFSPDGKRIAFARRRASVVGTPHTFIATMNADGSGQALLGGPELSPGVSPVYSPDGRKIAFQRDGRIWVMNADGSGQVDVSGGPPSALSPNWQPLADFRFGKLKHNKDKGTATLTVIVPAAGTLALSGKGVVKKRLTGVGEAVASKVVKAAGKVRLKIEAKGRKKRKLNRAGKAKLQLKVAYTPTGGTADVKTKKVKLKKRL